MLLKLSLLSPATWPWQLVWLLGGLQMRHAVAQHQHTLLANPAHLLVDLK